MKPITLALTLTLLADQAHALRCVRPDPVQVFTQLAASSDDYFVLYGKLMFDETDLPPAVRETGAAYPAPIPAQFIGKGLTQAGFTADYISPANLQIDCMANYCGTAQSGIDTLYFVRADQTPVTMAAGPCAGLIFPEPGRHVLDQLTACMQGGC